MTRDTDDPRCPICGAPSIGIVGAAPGPEVQPLINIELGPEPTSIVLRFECENGHVFEQEIPAG